MTRQSGPELEALLKTDEQWKVVIATRDVEAIIAYWTDDATICAPGQAPIVGKAAIREYVSSSLATPGFSITWRVKEAAVSDSGDLGYTTADNTVTVPGPDGELMTLRGRAITVWRKSPSGAWQCAVDLWNDAPP